MEKTRTKKECSACGGRKIVPGTCVCDSEWRGTQVDGDWNDCQCNPDEPCPTCDGKGYREE
ncbi:MAG: ankyrin [Thermodesulfobacteriota bacterium]